MKLNKISSAMTSLVAALAFTACSSDEADIQRNAFTEGNVISLTSQLATTRATSDPQTTALHTSNNVGVFVTYNAEAVANGDNNQHTVGANGDLTTSNTMNYPSEDGAKVNIYAYAPFASGMALNTANNFSVATDQSAEAGFLASDLVYASKTDQASSENAVSLNFAHKLSQLQITIQNEAEADLTNAEVYVTGTKTATTFTPSTGAVGTASGDAASIKVATISAATTVYAIVVPQDIAANTELVKIITSEKVYTAKITTATTLAGGSAYSFTVKLVPATTPVVEIPITLGATSITAWGTPTNLGEADLEQEAAPVSYSIGDYILTDGTFVKAADLTDAQKSSVAGIIFSTKVSTADATAGYNAYVMGTNREKQAFHISASNLSQMVTDNKINDLAPAIADLDGRTRTATMLASSYYTSLTDEQKSASIINLSWYTKTISANASDWFLPSFGQLVLIMNNLGDAGFTTYDFGEGGFASSSAYTVGDADALTTIAGKIQAYVTAAGGADNMFTVGNINYVSSTENGSNSDSHYGKAFSINFTQSAGWTFGKNLSRTNSENYSVIPVAAVTLPTE